MIKGMVEDTTYTVTAAHYKDGYDFGAMKVRSNGQNIGVVQGFLLKAHDYIYPDEKAVAAKEKKPLTHKDKLCGYVQTSGQLGGALGLVASGLLEGNIPRAALGGFNALRSSTKIISDFNAKSRASSHRNDLVEGGVATSANSIGFLNVRSPEELLAVSMGVTAWATKAITSFLHMKREKTAEEKQQDVDANNMFFSSREVSTPEQTPKPRIVGLIHRGLEKLKDASLETGCFLMSHAPPVMMGTRAVSYLMDGINNNDLAMAGGGASFIVGAALMVFKDHGSYMKARAERQASKENEDGLKQKIADDFCDAEFGAPLQATLQFKGNGAASLCWRIDPENQDAPAFVGHQNKRYNNFAAEQG